MYWKFCCCCWHDQVISGGQLLEILTIWLAAWFRAIPQSLVTMNDSRAIETEPLITMEFVNHSSIFRIVSLHWAILQWVLDRYTACKNFIRTKRTFSVRFEVALRWIGDCWKKLLWCVCATSETLTELWKHDNPPFCTYHKWRMFVQNSSIVSWDHSSSNLTSVYYLFYLFQLKVYMIACFC